MDAAAVQAVSEQVPRLAGKMNPQNLSKTLWAITQLADKGVVVDTVAVRAVSMQAPRVAGKTHTKTLSSMLWAIAKLAEKGMEVDVAAFQRRWQKDELEIPNPKP